MTEYLQTHIFNAGLQDNLCKEIMETAHGIFQATYEAALGLDVIQDENKPTKPIIVATTKLTDKEHGPSMLSGPIGPPPRMEKHPTPRTKTSNANTASFSGTCSVTASRAKPLEHYNSTGSRSIYPNANWEAKK
jgi:hypothetical protein